MHAKYVLTIIQPFIIWIQGTYKNQWSATANGTYWAGAKLLEQVAYEKELAKRTGKGKRKSGEGTGEGGAKKAKVAGEAAPRKKTASEVKLEALQLLQRINAVEGVPEGIVYDTCPQVVKKIKDFLQRDGKRCVTLCNLGMTKGFEVIYIINLYSCFIA